MLVRLTDPSVLSTLPRSPMASSVLAPEGPLAPMAQPARIDHSDSDVCVTMTGHLDDVYDEPKSKGGVTPPPGPGPPSGLARGSSVGDACSALFALRSSTEVPALSDPASAAGPPPKFRDLAAFDDALVGRVAASNRARQTALMPPPRPPAQRLPKMPPRPRPVDLVARCARFTAALKVAHPPGSPVFTLFRAFVTHGRDDRERREVIVELCELLRPDPRLLRLFYGLLPSWVFKR